MDRTGWRPGSGEMSGVMLIKEERQWKGARNHALLPGFWDLKLRAQIGRDLRAGYEKAMREPLPERLAGLVEQLERRERSDPGTQDHEPA